ncbi:GT-D fold domain-containing glycosyltransferase [Thermodesulfovibrio aggregans]|uniref:GT-D fold domain-containing glycosyltransferase n=1 Tax=Thermodesulfovibrio aggregans TaxID=86166 RepID=UPI001379C826|nr:GT-D fold domain-containing glycosyltransferase [Thermodesulfovibrio aggregans]
MKNDISIKSERPAEPIKRKRTIRAKVLKRVADIFNFFYRGPMIYNGLNSEESINLLLQNRKSLIRFGNGESEIMAGFDMGTQRYHPELRNSLIKILNEYSESSKYYLALTNWNLKVDVKTLKKRKNYKIWRYMRYFLWYFDIHGKSKLPFLETDMFRVGEAGLPNELIEKLWLPYEYIIVIHNSEKYFNWFKSKYPSKTMFFIKIPDRDFFFVLEQKQREILDIFAKYDIPKNNSVILVSAGPGAKVLCYNLSQMDFLCYDMGNYFHMRYRLEQNET